MNVRVRRETSFGVEYSASQTREGSRGNDGAFHISSNHDKERPSTYYSSPLPS